MAKTSQKKTSASKPAKSGVVWNFPLEKKDLVWLLIGVGIVILGYILLATGITEEPAVVDGKWNNFVAINIAPIVLILGYCVIIPMALMKFFTRSKKQKIAENVNDTIAK